MSKSIWPGVRTKTAKGKRYWYWVRVEPGTPWVRLPSPFEDADGFTRKLAHLQRVSVRIAEHKRDGTFGALVNTYRQSPDYNRLTENTRDSYDRYINRLLEHYGKARNQPKLAARAIGKWTKTERERENRASQGKP